MPCCLNVLNSSLWWCVHGNQPVSPYSINEGYCLVFSSGNVWHLSPFAATLAFRPSCCAPAHSLVVELPGVGAVLGHELQVLDADRLVLQLGHGVVDALLPGGDVILLACCGRRQLVPAQKLTMKFNCVATRVAAVYGITGVTGVEANTVYSVLHTGNTNYYFFQNKFSKNE